MFTANIPTFDSDDDEEIILHIEQFRAPKRYQLRINYLPELNDWEFYRRFRIGKETFKNLLALIEVEIQSPINRNHAIQPATKLLLTLQFLTTGRMLLVVADFCGVSESAACTIVKRVINAIAALRPNYVHMPNNTEDIVGSKHEFYQLARFPKVICAIDCTDVEIESPGDPDAEYYRNRKGWFSWNVQTICDAQLRICDIVVRWPESTHDQTIFNNSAVKEKFVNGTFGDALLLGLLLYLTHLQNHQLPEERLYNESQIRTRNAIERSYVVWKRRFPILSLCMRVGLQKSQNIIFASVVINNIAIEERGDEPPEEEEIVQLVQQYEERRRCNQPQENMEEQGNQLNDQRRTTLINEYFRNLGQL